MDWLHKYKISKGVECSALQKLQNVEKYMNRQYRLKLVKISILSIAAVS